MLVERGLLVLAVLAPFIVMGIVPLHDTSEPRYAEIARLMAQSGDWVTPWFVDGQPFWGKPPLAFWAQALSMRGLGVNEFAARLPAGLCLLLSNLVLLLGVRRVHGARVALWTLLVYDTCALVQISSTAVLTDPFLALGTTLSLVSYAVLIQQRYEASGALVWQRVFFVGLAVGLLAKGPLALVASLVPVAGWMVFKRSRAPRLAWGWGLTLTAALSLPWYILAEIKTPGFLQYFLVGEHVLRFLDSGWQGDLYGSAHQRAYGTIWGYWLLASFPWGCVLLTSSLVLLCRPRWRGAMRAAWQSLRGHPLFFWWLTAALWVPLLFTFSANILWTYVLPALAGFSVLVAHWITQLQGQLSGQAVRLRSSVLACAAFAPLVMLVLAVIVWYKPDLGKTERGLVRSALHDDPLLYLESLPFSAQFYSAGRARAVTRVSLVQQLTAGRPFYLALPLSAQTELTAQLGATPWQVVYRNRRHVLLRIF